MVSATVLALLLSVTSCSRKDTRHVPEALTRAERLMWDAPESAQHNLSGIWNAYGSFDDWLFSV